jgi:predicted TIM-barrel fold metal-dependent hydrolase
MKIVSADSHFNEPPEFYDDLHKKYGDSVPHIESDSKGSYWVSDGFKRPLGVMNQPGARLDSIEENVFIDSTKYIYDLDIRRSIVEKDGVSMELLFPSGAMLHTIKDNKIRLQCFKTLNNYLSDLDGFYRGVLQVPNNPRDALKIISNYNNIRFIMFPIYLPDSSYSDGNWNQCFELCEKKDIIICFHAGALRYKNLINSNIFQSYTHKTSILFFQAYELLNDLILGGIAEKFDGLKFIISELGVSWVPYWYHRITTGLSIYSSIDGLSSKNLIQILNKKFYFTTQFDFPDNSLFKIIGENNVLFGTDFPHVESTHGQTINIFNDINKKLGKGKGSRIFYKNFIELM